jgi:hypothetical protein
MRHAAPHPSERVQRGMEKRGEIEKRFLLLKFSKAHPPYVESPVRDNVRNRRQQVSSFACDVNYIAMRV